ncbi:MAG: ATP-binding protein [Spirochaetaceae bacterium]|nr:ATP-binding protein [Spirochaetaceae bacterium]
MIQRTIEKHISSLMNEYFSVSIFGPRQCGKTTLAKNLFPSFSYANLEDMNVRSLAKNDPEEFFTRFPEPVIIDEIQRVPELLSTVQVRIDKNQKKGQYLITGSQQISLKSSITQSLAGRTAIVQMLPLSISELYSANIKLDRDSQLISGFMPFLYAESGHSPFEYYKNYVNTYLERDIVQIAAVHDLIRFEKFMRLLAGRVGQLVNNSILATEVGVSSTTIGSWLSVLEASHVIYTLKPWFKNRNSQVVKTPKIYFCDTGLVSYLLGIETPEQMIRDPLLGNVFENFVVIEALKTRLNLGLEPNLYFFRNSNGLEIDLILQEQNKLKLFEIKSGKSLNDEFCRNMKNFSAKYNEEIASDSTKGTVIYSGENYESYKDFGFYNFSKIPQLFESKTSTFRLHF